MSMFNARPYAVMLAQHYTSAISDVETVSATYISKRDIYSVKRSDVTGYPFEWLLGEIMLNKSPPPYFIVLDC